MIDEVTYKLPKENYVQTLTAKKQIVIGHTFNHDMKHYVGWVNRFNGKYKKTAAYTIAIDGTVYQHFDPVYHSDFFGNKVIDSKRIVILLENDGRLIKDVEKKIFITWLDDIYNNGSGIIEKRWRGYNFWCPYSEKQIDSAIKTIKKLCVDFSIPIVSVSHNTKIDNIDNYEGVLYRSNLDRHYTDLSPSWDFEKFKNKLENKIE